MDTDGFFLEWERIRGRPNTGRYPPFWLRFPFYSSPVNMPRFGGGSRLSSKGKAELSQSFEVFAETFAPFLRFPHHRIGDPSAVENRKLPIPHLDALLLPDQEDRFPLPFSKAGILWMAIAVHRIESRLYPIRILSPINSSNPFRNYSFVILSTSWREASLYLII